MFYISDDHYWQGGCLASTYFKMSGNLIVFAFISSQCAGVEYKIVGVYFFIF